MSYWSVPGFPFVVDGELDGAIAEVQDISRQVSFEEREHLRPDRFKFGF